MAPLNRQPLLRQLVLSTMAASGLAILLLSVSFVAFDRHSFGEAIARRMSTEADMVGRNAATALLFGDPDAARDTLAGLTAEPTIATAAIYRADGELFARYVVPGHTEAPALPPREAKDAPRERQAGGYLIVSAPIVFKGSRIGTVVIEASEAEKGERLRSYLGVAAVAAVGAFVISLLMSLEMQRRLSRPILALAETARRVSADKDYGLRADDPSGPAEIGVLLGTFNEMLEGIQRRDADVRSAHQRAEEANRVKDQFLATLSHELRTPLNAIVGWASVLSQGILKPDEQRSAVEKIVRNARAQGLLIEDMLDMSRITSGKLHLTVSLVDLPAVIQGAIDAVKPGADAKQIRLQVILDTQGAAVSGDPVRLQQVLWNLLSNAIKFSPRGGRVYVRLTRPNSHVEILVSDTGMGISREFLPHVFERFRQADGSSTRQHGGLGLGLAIVRHIVELHGGTVEASSDGEGQGASFLIKLPVVPVAIPPAASPRAPADPAAVVTPLQTLRGLLVLVVDDDPDSRELLQRFLQDYGARVAAAPSVEAALEAVAAEVPDVVISDIEMPRADGYELIRRLRALPPERGGSVPAAALTAYGRVQDRVTALQAGFQIHLAKPIDAAELMVVVGSLAGRKTAPLRLPPPATDPQ